MTEIVGGMGAACSLTLDPLLYQCLFIVFRTPITKLAKVNREKHFR